jgi:hypothetical protein
MSGIKSVVFLSSTYLQSFDVFCLLLPSQRDLKNPNIDAPITDHRSKSKVYCCGFDSEPGPQLLSLARSKGRNETTCVSGQRGGRVDELVYQALVQKRHQRYGIDSAELEAGQNSFELLSTSRSNPSPLDASPRPTCFCARSQVKTPPPVHRVFA